MATQTMTNDSRRISELEAENAQLRRYIDELREAVAALMEPPPAPPVDDKQRLWRETHPGEARREKYNQESNLPRAIK